MPDIRKNVECDYCGAHAHIKFPDDLKAIFCIFCGETLDAPGEVVDEEDDGDLDYVDDEREETDDFN
jgi:hypothetical protein